MERQQEIVPRRATVAFLREEFARAREIVEGADWAAEAKHAASELRELLIRNETNLRFFQALRVCGRVREMLAHLPPRLVLSAEEREKMGGFVAGVLDEFPDATWSDLLWLFAVDAVRPRARGRKAKWAGVEGVLFVVQVDVVLEARGWRRSSKKGLLKAIAIVQKSAPQHYGKLTANALRAGYYAALPHYATARAAIVEF